MNKKKIDFDKLEGAGNDFVLIDNRVYKISSTKLLQALARKMCDRKLGAGADGLLVLERSRVADVRMRIINADGSEAEMCGNGARCFAYNFARQKKALNNFSLALETKAGIVKAQVFKDNVKINLTPPKDLKLDIPLKVSGRTIKVNVINTGVPHAVIFVQGLDKIDVQTLGCEIRNHRYFAPAGTNVNFVEVLNRDSMRIRTYERGVEAETLACGTGSTAAALITSIKMNKNIDKINVHTAGGEILKISFNKSKNSFSDVWLEGRARLVYRGEYYV
ncbi:MAG: diaminopimelate epimerase [Candidatus Omnitrophica bacterium]|nr:diaminopimelate epimerase [Candidatus Omnitrophota bacterium]